MHNIHSSPPEDSDTYIWIIRTNGMTVIYYTFLYDPGLITNPAILLQQGQGRPLPPFNNNQATIVRQDGDSVNTYSTLNSVNTNSRTATG